MPDRKLITKEDLRGILNKELEKYPESEGCFFDFPMGPKEMDKIGCNWTPNFIEDCHIATEPDCIKKCIEIGNKMRAIYNLI